MRPIHNQVSFRHFFKEHLFLIISGVLSALAYGYLAYQSQSYAQAKLSDLWIVCISCGVLSFMVWGVYYFQEKHLPIALLVFFAILFRLIGIIGFPVLEDDFYRYLWDGRMTIETGSPYLFPPSYYFDIELNDQFEAILGLINYPDIATVYGPICQWLFALTYLLFPGEVWPLQTIFALADLGIILILLRMAKPVFVLLYAWSPLLIKEFAFTAHPDVLGALFLLAAFFTYTRHYIYWAAILLALAAGVKVFALIIAPILLRFNWRAWSVFIATAILIALPFGIKNAWIPEGLQAMAGTWLFNAPLYYLFSWWASIDLIKATLLAIFATSIAAYFVYLLLKKQHLPIRADYLFGLLFLCTPVFNAWYLVWLLPFAVIYSTCWAWVASVSVFLSYASGINMPDSQLDLYQQPGWSLIIQFGVILVALLCDITRPNKRH